MLKFLILCGFCLFVAASAYAADEVLPALQPNPGVKSAIERSFKINLMRDQHDPTLVEVMVQIDKPAVPMAFDVSLRFGNKTVPVGPMAWDKIQWWAYDIDIPVGVKSADLIFTANPAAVRRLQIINPFAVRGLTTVWDGTATVNDIKISEQMLAGMEAYLPAKPELLPQFFADELVGHSDAVDKFRQNFDTAAAQAAMEKLLQENPHDAVVQYNLGCIAAAQTNWQRAVEFLGQARSAPNSPVTDDAQRQLRRIGGWVNDLASREKNTSAMFTLATMYENGWGPARDLQIAKRYYRNAANAGDARAMTRLGDIYAQDLKVANDAKTQAWLSDEMLSMYRQAAKLNEPEAKAWLAQHDAQPGAVGLAAVPATRAAMSADPAEAKPADSPADYDQWIATYAAKSLDDNLLEITLVEERSHDIFGGDRSSIFRFTVKSNGKNWRQSSGPRGSRGGDGNAVDPQALTRLRELVSELPADVHRLPPAERRVLVQTASATRIYDRANLPDAVIELFRISNAGIGGWHYTFKSQREIDIRTGGPLLLDPSGKRLLCGLEFLAMPTYETLGELELEGYDGIAMSPNGTIAALTDARGASRCGCQIFDPATSKLVRTLEEPQQPRSRVMVHLHDACFTPDARGLVFSASDELRYFDTTTWQRVSPAPGIPAAAVQWNPSKTWRHAVMLTKAGVICIWDAQSKSSRELDSTSFLQGAAFSPDESLLALATSNKDRYSNPRLRIFKTETGQLAHELRFDDVGGDGYAGPQWTPDGRYILAVTKPRGASNYRNVSLWSAKSGRHRADFDCDLGAGGFVLLPPGDQLIVSSGGGLLRSFDLAGAIQKTSVFEDPLSPSTALQPGPARK